METQVRVLTDERKKDQQLNTELLQHLEKLTSKTKENNIPNHLSGVREEHLPSLQGFRMKYKVRGNGRCLENCTAIHTLGDEEEGIEIRKMINNRMADDWESYWKTKIALPFKEVLTVDGEEVVIEKGTDKEMIEFLRSEIALKVYSTGHEILAIANLFNIRVHIFTYKGNSGRWNVVHPDPASGASVELGASWAPDMFLYHSNDIHYDLLVRDDSPLAQVDLREPLKQSDEWKTVKPRKHASNFDAPEVEKLLAEDEPKETDTEDLN